MTPHPYQTAYDTAAKQLSDIAAEIEYLRARKSLIENVIQALMPLVNPSEATTSHASAGTEAVNQPTLAKDGVDESEPPEGYSFRDVPSPLPDLSETEGNPFQRRVKASFRFGGLATQRSL